MSHQWWRADWGMHTHHNLTSIVVLKIQVCSARRMKSAKLEPEPQSRLFSALFHLLASSSSHTSTPLLMLCPSTWTNWTCISTSPAPCAQCTSCGEVISWAHSLCFSCATSFCSTLLTVRECRLEWCAKGRRGGGVHKNSPWPIYLQPGDSKDTEY